MAALTATALAAGIGGIASAGAGIANYAANMSAADRAAALQDRSLQEWLKLNIPDPREQEVALEQFVSQGTIVPKLESAISQNPSEFKKITTNAGQKTAQNRALSELEKLGYEGGLGLQDRADLQDSMMQSQVADRGNRQAIEADAARRGMGGSGFELQSRLAGQQSTGDRDANNSLKIAAQARDRALQAIMGAGDLATRYRTQDFSEQSETARAEDAINRFNTGNLQDVQSRNIGNQNRTSEINAREKQRIADANTGLSNQQQLYNSGLKQQNFENQMAVTAGKSGQYGGQAAMAQNQGQMAGNFYSNLGTGIKDTTAALAKTGVDASNTAKTEADFWSEWEKKNAPQNRLNIQNIS